MSRSQTHTRLTLAAGSALLLLAAAPAPAAAQALPDSVVIRRLAALADSLAAAGQFSGTILLARHDTAIFARAWGLADRATGRRNTIETAFNLASVGKLFTRTAIEQLEHAGKLSDDSTIAAYWPDYPNRAFAHAATIAQLMNMSSGIGGDIFGTPGTTHSIRTLQDYLRQFVNEPPAFAPGTKRAYSNAGYVVLGALVERASGEEYFAYLRRHIFEPAGMTRTGAFDRDSLPPFAAIGYTRNGPTEADTALHPNTEGLPGRGSPAGGSYSTVTDLLRYVHAVRSGAIAGTSGKLVPWAGGTPGANTILLPNMPDDHTLIVLANMDPPVAMEIGNRVREWLGASAP
ncbi:MAG: serine hydrolase domain-containing protein [Gemmatimonadaceae bacterium]